MSYPLSIHKDEVGIKTQSPPGLQDKRGLSKGQESGDIRKGDGLPRPGHVYLLERGPSHDHHHGIPLCGTSGIRAIDPRYFIDRRMIPSQR
jgi:hypothetical protein